MEVKYLSDNLELKTLEVSDVPSSPTNGISPEEGTSDKKVWKYPLVSISGVPEIKMETCYKEVTTPFGKVKVPYPCTCTRSGRHWLELKVHYPSDLAGDIVTNIEHCAEVAAIYTAGVIAVGIVAPSLLPPAIPSAKVLFWEKFTNCLAEETSKLVDYDITYEHESGDWSC
ncbi:hypothetical protein R0126_11970 [Bacillus stratosphericus]|nr:hypothetical protein R0126_11970 [Bacillus stratosphericus]